MNADRFESTNAATFLTMDIRSRATATAIITRSGIAQSSSRSRTHLLLVVKARAVKAAALTIVLFALALCTQPALAQNPAPGPQVRAAGIVDSFNGQILVLKTADGKQLTVAVPESLAIRANAKATLADIKPGDFVGSAADKGPDGTLHAEEVHIFPEAMRGTGEGHRPMGPDPNRTMTNGTASAASDPEDRTMTNGTVNGVAGKSKNKALTIQYKDGTQTIEVAPDTPIVMLIPGDRTLLKPGATVSIIATHRDDGSLQATTITAEKDGVKPR